jgi:SAM-dependent methyltransferase
MGMGYALAYRFGFTPWERAGRDSESQFQKLLDREQDPSQPRGRALDLGCGRGVHSLELASRGWEVTGVDLEPRAIAAARERAAQARLRVTFLTGDVTDLPPQVGTGYDFVLDIGCFHGLSPQQQVKFGQQVDAVTSDGATMLLLAFSAGMRGPVPRGADYEDVARALPQWSILDQRPADATGLPVLLTVGNPQFYRLRKNELLPRDQELADPVRWTRRDEADREQNLETAELARLMVSHGGLSMRDAAEALSVPAGGIDRIVRTTSHRPRRCRHA